MRTFKWLNLINSGTSFSSVFFVLGRYYQKNIKYLPTLNKVIAEDLSSIYTQMCNQLIIPVNDSFLEELGRVHEKMYVVFYNCYFCQHVAMYKPRWIKTDIHDQEILITREKKREKSMNLTMTVAKR